MKRMMKNFASIFLALLFFAEVIPLAQFPESKALAATEITLTNMMSQAFINKLRLQKKETNIRDLTGPKSIFQNYTSRVTKVNVETEQKANYPLNDYFFWSATAMSSTASYSAEYKWDLNSTETEHLMRLFKLQKEGNQNNILEIGSSAFFYTDTQDSIVAGYPFFEVTFGSSELSALSFNVGEDTNTARDYVKRVSSWVPLTGFDRGENFIFTGKVWSKGGARNRNYARVRYPEIYLRDTVAPYFRSISVNKSNNSSVNYVNGDELLIDIVFNEPVRATDNKFCDYIDVRLNGSIISCVPVSYDDKTFTLTVKHLIEENDVVEKGHGTLTASLKSNKMSDITDLAGNTFDVTKAPASSTNANMVIDGTTPRIRTISAAFAVIKNAENKYELSLEQGTDMKPGDILAFDVSFSQKVANRVQSSIYFPVMVGDTYVNATPALVYDGTNIIEYNGMKNVNDSSLDFNFNWHKTIAANTPFDKITFVVKIPETAKSGDDITIPTKTTGGMLELLNGDNVCENIKGNLRVAVDKRKSVSTQTLLPLSTSILGTLKVDATPPTITITDEEGNPSPFVKDNYPFVIELKDKQPSFKIAFRTDQELKDDVSYKIYSSATDGYNEKLIASGRTLAYMTEKPDPNALVTVTIPDGTDDTTTRYYIDLQCHDRVYNPYNPYNNHRANRKWFQGDRIAPYVNISDQGVQDTATERYYQFEVTSMEDSSPDGVTLFYKFSGDNDGGEYKSLSYVGDTNTTQTFTVASAAIVSTQTIGGTFTCYVEDGSGNRSKEYTRRYFIGATEIGEITILTQGLDEYLGPRDIEFSGFTAPTAEFTEYLEYHWGDGNWNQIKAEAENVIIPADSLTQSGIITYRKKRVNNASGTVYSFEYTEIYRCDNQPPGIELNVVEMSGNKPISFEIMAPVQEDHPNNLVSATLTVRGFTDKQNTFVDLTSNIIEGQLLWKKTVEEVLEEAGLPAGGWYIFTFETTDANGHTSKRIYPDTETYSTVYDKPTVTNVSLKTGLPYSEHAPFAEWHEPILSVSDPYTQVVAVTDEVVKEAISNDKRQFTTDPYYLFTDLSMEFYASNSGSTTIAYSLSEDGGVSWSEFENTDVNYHSVDKIDNDWMINAKVCVKLPQPDEDGVYTYSIKYKFGDNPYETDRFDVKVVYDRKAPVANSVVAAVRNGEEYEWNTDIQIAGYQEKVDVYVFDESPLNIIPQVEIISMTILNSDGDYSESIYSDNILDNYDEEKGSYEIIVGDIVSIKYVVRDAFGNETEYTYKPQYVDYRIMGHNSFVASDGTIYIVEYDSVSTEFGLITSASMTEEEEKAQFEQYKGIMFDIDLISEAPGERGDSCRIYRVRQKELATWGRYALKMTSTDVYGYVDKTIAPFFQVNPSTLQEKPYENTVKNQGNVVRVHQRLEFDEPVTIIKKSEVDPDEILIIEMERILEETAQRFEKVVDVVLSSAEDSEFYVSDRFGTFKEMKLDIGDTNFVSYPEYSIEYYRSVDGVDTLTAGNALVGGLAPAKAVIKSNLIGSGTGVVAKCRVSLEEGGIFSVNDAFSITADQGWYSQMVLENSTPTEFDGASYAQAIKIKDTLTGDEYKDVIHFECFDGMSPQLLGEIMLSKKERNTAQRVVYLFHDQSGFSEMTGTFTTGDGVVAQNNINFSGGVYSAIYDKNGIPELRVVDEAGNEYIPTLSPITSVQPSDLLIEGTDFEIVAFTDSEETSPCEDDRYYTRVFASVKPIDGGKAFTGGDTVELTSSNVHVFVLVDNNGNTVLAAYYPPIDVTPPRVIVRRGGVGGDITFEINATDTQSGVATVYFDEEQLTEVSKDEYEKTVSDSGTHTITVTDDCGNQSVREVSTNKIVYEPLVIEVSKDNEAPTNRNVMVTLTAQPGREPIYYLDTQPDGYLSLNTVLLSGNRVIFTQSGRLRISVVDEGGNLSDPIDVEVTNIDKMPPVIIGEVKPINTVEGAQQFNTRRAVEVSFRAEVPKNAEGEVFLVNERGVEQSEEIRDYFGNLAENLSNGISIGKVIPLQDITNPNTKVILTKNGTYSFLLQDKAGNTTKASVKIDQIDDISAEFSKLEWSYQYLSKDSNYEVFVNSNGEIEDVKIGAVDNRFAESSSMPLTNQNITITVHTNEPVKELGDNSGLKDYKEQLTKEFANNGRYTFNLLDMANNISQATVNLELIEKRIPQIEFQNSAQDICLFEADIQTYNKEEYTGFRVYKYNGNEKVYLSAEEYTVNIDWDGFNPDDITANTFDRTRPYVIKYTLWDKAGNRRETQKTFTLVGLNDTVVTVDGRLPNAYSEVVTDSQDVKIVVRNYDHKSYAKIQSGRYSSSQMKRRGEVLALDNGTKGTYTLKDMSQGWHTISITTQHQDNFNIYIYVTQK